MTIYKNRYQAKKHANTGEKVVKVSGGYTIMTPTEYREWKQQK